MGSNSNGRPRIVKTLREVCVFFGVAYNTVQKWKLNGMPCLPDGYDLAAIAMWRESRKPAPSKNDTELAAIREQKIREQYRGLKMENDLTAGELCYVDDISREWHERVSNAKAYLEEIAERCEVVLPADIQHDIAQRIERVIHDTLIELSEVE